MAAETTIDSAINTTSNGPILYTEHEEYRYDALGRRIWVRSIHAATCHIWYPNGDCASALKREVWDGASLIYESRYPGDLNLPAAQLEQETGAAGGTLGPRFGRVAYLNGGDLDHPLAEIKMDGGASTATFAPRYNWRGLAEEAACAAGQSCGTQYFGASSVSAYYEQVPTPNGPPAWSGSLIEGSRDASGLLYKRNRYYDPASGRFTSQDPLGLGGGLNVYGFAGGDPVNQDDPFGLCPWNETPRQSRANHTQSGLEPCAPEEGLVSETPSTLDVAMFAGGVGPEEEAEKETVVIGENMKDRVIPYAEKIGAKYYKAVGKRAENWMANNKRWIQRVIKAGKKVVDIGEDASRTKRSDNYRMEKDELKRQNYPVTSDPQPPSQPY